MKIPVVPLLSLFGIIAGSYGLYFYANLTEDQKKEADRLAAAQAMELFGKQLDQLTPAQAQQVHALVRARFDH
jgi:hypothetical protein